MVDSTTATEQLVQRAHDGDRASIETLMQRYRERLRRMVCARMDPRVSARVDASDVIQDALTAASRQLPKYLETQPIPFYPWLRRIAWQKLVHIHEMHLDTEKRSAKKENDRFWGMSDHSASHFASMLEGSFSSPSAALARKENQRLVRDALGRLSEIDREVLLQRYVEQMSVKDIAAVLGLTEGAIHMRHMRALEKLHQLLSSQAS